MTHHTDAERAEFDLMRFAFESKGSEAYKAWLIEVRDGDSYKPWDVVNDWRNWQTAWQAARRAPAAPSAWKDNDTAKLVNDLRDCAVQYHATAQLRERIAHLVRPLAARLAGAPAAPVPQGWIDPNDKAQKQYLPHIGERVLFKQDGRVYLGKHTGGSFKAEYPFGKTFGTWDCKWMYPSVLDAAAPQPPEAGCSVSNGETQAAPVQLPEYGIDTANHAGIRVRGYTEQQVRQLLANHGIQEQST